MAKLSLKTKLIILSALPLVCAIGFGLKLTIDRFQETREFLSFEESMELAAILAETGAHNANASASVWSFVPTAIQDNDEKTVLSIRRKFAKDSEALETSIERAISLWSDMEQSRYSEQLHTVMAEVETQAKLMVDHRVAVAAGLPYNEAMAEYNRFKSILQRIYPALIQETSDKDLSLMLLSYNLFLDFQSEASEYMGLMIWGHQTDDYPLDAYAHMESHFSKSDLALKHFRNLATGAALDKVDAILDSEEGKWVDQKTRSLLIDANGGKFYDFPRDVAVENELKQKGEGRNFALADLMADFRQEILDTTADKIRALKFKRNATAAITLLFTALSIFLNLWLSNRISRSITRITKGVAEGTERLHAAADQINNASQTLADNSCFQASSSEETSSMIANLIALTQSTAKNAEEANTQITSTSHVIEESHTNMQRLDQSITLISSNSDETQKIMESINDIAFQTNILALNAAVEAARAGEAGAGFAVVADEVRTLAQRSAKASENTTALIESSNNSISNGVDCAKEATRTFSKVRENAADVFQKIRLIEEETAKQAEAISEIERAAEKVDSTAQSNAASSEECASSAASLSAEASRLESYVHNLQELVNGFGGSSIKREQPAKRNAPTKRSNRVNTHILN
ncbi:methyl-accepting chemotaxis protein [Pelagicoccus mobilis]|uniref:Methyl-accepting transducer domain-containing protein n=1 Tax=Pelagicoccus mobilis TaxID=415221 RepID=A0A934RUQ1_9BACT|nr:methyl-accepting chemotaxis protein [Pelagicoccus mobilis]MBK1875775.1 hypothetical protein [Pelagicoccus mobilis]